jgi:hypothetical protein
MLHNPQSIDFGVWYLCKWDIYVNNFQYIGEDFYENVFTL